MKLTRKLIAYILAVLTALSLCAFSASAVEAPSIAIVVVSEDSSTLVLSINLKSGKFNALDIALSSSANLTCTKIATAKQYRDFRDEVEAIGGITTYSSNNATGKISVSSTESFLAPTELFTVTYSKKTADATKPGDIKATITNCAVREGAENINVTASTSVAVVLGRIDISSDAVELKYKDQTLLTIDTSLADEDIVWTSSDENVATVDEVGKIHATGRGTATITASSVDGSISDTVEVTVKYTFGQWLIIIFLFGWIWY